MEPLNIIEPVIAAADVANAAVSGDYTQDGLVYCGKCHTPKQCRQNFMGHGLTVVGCLCKCAQEAYNQETATRRKQEEADRITRLRNSGISSQEFRNARFSLDDGQNPNPMSILRRYVDNWEQEYRENNGLLLWGGVGTGKSFGAACIANALIERSIPACMVNLSVVLNTLTNSQNCDRNQYIEDLMQYHMLILDDVGIERKTEFAQEQVFNIIDARCRSGKPLVVTTNIPLATLRNPVTLEQQRIYDRILGMCVPVSFGEKGRRQAIAATKIRRAAALLKQD